MSVHDVNYGRFSVDRVSGSPFPTTGRENTNLGSGMDQLHVRGESFVPSVASVSAVCDVSLSSLFNPSSLFPLGDSGVSSFLSSLPTPVSSSSGLSTVVLSVPPSPVPIFSFPSVVPSLLSASSLAPSSYSFSLLTVPSTSLPPPAHLSVSSSSSFTPPLSTLSSAFHSSASTLRPSFPFSSSSSVLSSGAPPAPPSSSALPPSSSSSSGDFASFQANVLGLSAEYQALGRWFVASGGDDFPSYLSAHFPHLAHDFRVDLSSGSFRFLAALASSNSIPTPSSSFALSASVGPSSVTPRVPYPPPSAPLSPSVSPPWVPGAPALLYPPVASAPFLLSFFFFFPLSSAFGFDICSGFAFFSWVFCCSRGSCGSDSSSGSGGSGGFHSVVSTFCFGGSLRCPSLRLLLHFHLLLFHLSLPLPLLILEVLQLPQPLLLHLKVKGH